MKKTVTLHLTYDDADSYIVALMQAIDFLLHGAVEEDVWDEDQLMTEDEVADALFALQASLSKLID